MPETKRNFSQVADVSEFHDDKKQHTKPGRKPIDTEPKSKRTAQNRAAQRAYRERKERKMKDLEDKVADLEDDKIKAATELDLLRAQIELLKRELTRYRGHLDFSDLGVKKSDNVVKQEQLPETTPQEPKYMADFPWSKENLQNLNNSQLPDLVSGSSSSTSPLNDNVIVSPESNTSESVSSNIMLSLSPQNQFNLVSLFDEQLDPFCVNLNEACGNKLKPMPKFHRPASEVPPLPTKFESVLSPQWNGVSPFHTLFSPNENLSDPFFADNNYNISTAPTDGLLNEPLSFLNDNNFDVSLAFGNATNDLVDNQGKTQYTDPLAGLTNEESVYDPLNLVNTDFNFNEFVKSSLPSDVSSRTNSVTEGLKSGSSVSSYHSSPLEEDDSKEEVVPAPEKTIRCSEIWDRITSHPRYTEIDIDGLCNELKTKAKCSEKGVVLDSKDVNKLIERLAMRR
ncbi:CIC11C00000003887 [Sungouiella intermedia]|uniref:CIC11C00000003887 n=1 Tax=Sungouiella intermedia TaxID=45354 RepID=A0A1L0BHI6_9ASCO|nr:CIC11C00000003887 [[Candida] intermedia]SGZ51223.1 CIC11C00000005514 [[Candida] intermedia]